MGPGPGPAKVQLPALRATPHTKKIRSMAIRNRDTQRFPANLGPLTASTAKNKTSIIWLAQTIFDCRGGGVCNIQHT